MRMRQDKGRLQCVSKQRTECCYLRQVICACNIKNASALSPVIHLLACHYNIEIYGSLAFVTATQQYTEVSQFV